MRRIRCGIAAVAVLALSLPRTAVAQTAAESIRVAIAQDVPEVDLKIKGQFTVKALGSNEPIHTGNRLDQVAVKATEGGILLGDQTLAARAVRIEPQRDADINVNGRHLRGTIEIMRKPDSTLQVVNHVPLEDYLRGVVSREAPDYWPSEALKAIAIAARSYAVYQRLTKADQPFDVRADVMSQDYGGKSSEKLATTRAVNATTGIIMTWQGKVFPTFYHSTCGGMTENGKVMGKYDLPPLKGGVACRFCSASPFYSWQRRFTKADVAWALKKNDRGSVGVVRAVQVVSRTPSGRAQEILIAGSARSLKISAYDLRLLFGFDRIRSPLISIYEDGGDFVIDGHGWGHGVGMCQWGACELARRGMKAPEILRFYYPGVEFTPLSSAGENLTAITGG